MVTRLPSSSMLAQCTEPLLATSLVGAVVRPFGRQPGRDFFNDGLGERWQLTLLVDRRYSARL